MYHQREQYISYTLICTSKPTGLSLSTHLKNERKQCLVTTHVMSVKTSDHLRRYFRDFEGLKLIKGQIIYTCIKIRKQVGGLLHQKYQRGTIIKCIFF